MGVELVPLCCKHCKLKNYLLIQMKTVIYIGLIWALASANGQVFRNEDEYGSFSSGSGSFSSGSGTQSSNLIFDDRYPGDTYVGDIGSEYAPGQFGSEFFMARPVAQPATSVILPPVRPASFVFTPNGLGSVSSSSVLYNNNHGANYVRDIGSEFLVDQSGLSVILPPGQPGSGVPASSNFTPVFRTAGTPQNNNVQVGQVAAFDPSTGTVTLVAANNIATDILFEGAGNDGGTDILFEGAGNDGGTEILFDEGAGNDVGTEILFDEGAGNNAFS